MENQKAKKEIIHHDDRDLIPVSDLDEELDIPLIVKTPTEKQKLQKGPAETLGYR